MNGLSKLLLIGLLSSGVILDTFGETTAELGFTNGPAGRQAQLYWNSQPGARHRVAKSTNLVQGAWQSVDVSESQSEFGQWVDPGTNTNLAFYSVSNPEPEVFGADPPVISRMGGGSMHIYGQSIPSNSLLRLNLVTTGGRSQLLLGPSSPVYNLIAETGGIWRVDFPVGAFNGVTRILSAELVDSSGVLLCPMAVDLTLTDDGRAPDAPADTPIAAPQPWHESTARLSINCKGAGAKRTPAPGLPGEVTFNEVDLEMETPAGPPLRWVRTYRSKFPTSSGHGEGWDFNYNISIQPVGGGTTNAYSLLLHDGSGRMDSLYRGTDGVYRADGIFREGHFEGGEFVLTFADKGTWRFNALVSTAEPARIHQITDRFGVALTCSYDANNTLASVQDQFGRSISVNWGGSKIVSVGDYTGRAANYSYDTSGMLVMAITPGTHTNTYSYSGNNITNIVDGEGRSLEAFTYSSQTNALEPDYDAVYSHEANTMAGAAAVEIVTFGPAPADIRAPGGYTMFLNDELGRLNEVVFSARHTPYRNRRYTGFCTPGQPVSASSNRPASPLRPGDPAYFETTFAYNIDSALTRITHPDGSGFSMVYERDINPSTNARERGNMRTASMIPAGGGTPVKVSFTYQPGFGAPESARPGNPIGGISVKGGKHPGGNLVASPNARPGAPVKGLSVKGGTGGQVSHARVTGSGGGAGSLDLLPQGLGVSKPVPGIGIVGKKGPFGISASRGASPPGGGTGPNIGPEAAGVSKPVPSIGIIVKHSPCYDKNCTRPSCRKGYARGYAPSGSGDGDDADIELPAMLRNLLGYDTSNESIGMPTEMVRDGLRWSWEYNANGALTRCVSPIPGSSLEADYNTNGQCTLARQIDGTNAYVCNITYSDYNEGGNGFPALISDQHGTYASTTQFLYDELGRLIQMMDPVGGDSVYIYNEAGQLADYDSPIVAGSQRIRQSLDYDLSGRLVRMDIQHRDEAGNLDLNEAYSTLIQRDARGRIVRELVEERPSDPTCTINTSDYQVVEYTYNAAGQIMRVRTPAASLEQKYDVVCDYGYDERGFLHRVVAGGTNAPNSVTNTFDYDLYGNLARHAILTGGVIAAEETFEYDGFQRCINAKDAAGNIATASYGERGLVTMELHGEVNDVPGTNNNVLLSRVRLTLATASELAVSGVTRYLKHAKTAEATRNLGAIASGARAAYGGQEEDTVDPASSVLLSRFRSRGVGGAIPGGLDIGGGPGKDRVLGTGDDGDREGAPGDKGIDRMTMGASGFAMNADAIAVDRNPGFLLWPVEDDVIEIDRFMPGSTVAISALTKRTDRSPAGLPLMDKVSKDVVCVYGYDAFGDLTCLSNIAQRVDFTKDPAGHVTGLTRTDYFSDGVTPAKSFSYIYDYDELGRLTRITDGVGNQQTLAYDSLGRPVRFTDATGFTRKYEYDGGDGTNAFSWRVIGDVDRDGIPELVLGSELARGGLLRRTRDANGYTTSLIRDSLGRLVSVAYPDFTGEAFEYDGRGYLSRYTKQDGTVIAYERNPLGSVYHATPIIVPPPATFTNDQTYTYNGRGQLTGIFITNGPSVMYDYDSWGNLISDHQAYGSVTNSFNDRGRTGYKSSVGGFQVIEQRDALGRLTSVSRSGAPVATLTYAGNRLHKSTSANGVVTTFEYVGDVSAGSVPDNFGFDQIGRIVVQAGAETNEELRVYDRDLRLKSVQISEGTTARNKSWSLDALGHITNLIIQQTVGGISSSNEFAYRLAADGTRLSVTGGANAGNYSKSALLPAFDAQMGQYTTWPHGPVEWTQNGELALLSLPGGTNYFQFDTFGRLTSATNTTEPSRDNDSDGDGRIIQTTSSNAATRFIYDGDVCIQEISTVDGMIISRVASDGAIFGITVSGTNYLIHGGMNEPVASKWPILSGIPSYMKDVIVDDDSTMTFRGHRPAVKLADASAESTPSIVERWDFDQDGAPIFLDAAGTPSATGKSAIGPIMWLTPDAMWLPDVRLVKTPAGYYNPDIGRLCGSTRHF